MGPKYYHAIIEWPLIVKVHEFGKDFISGWGGGITFAKYVPDVFPVAGTDSAVSGDRVGGSAGTLFGQGAICQVILTEHLYMDAEFLDVICRENSFQDMMWLSIESSGCHIEQSHSAVGGGILTEPFFMVGCHQ